MRANARKSNRALTLTHSLTDSLADSITDSHMHARLTHSFACVDVCALCVAPARGLGAGQGRYLEAARDYDEVLAKEPQNSKARVSERVCVTD